MDLTAREAARLLNVSLDVLEAWVKSKSLPAHRVNEHYRFNRAQLLEWATAQGMPLSADSFRAGSGHPAAEALLLTSALARGGLIADVPGEHVRGVLKELVGRLPLPEGTDRTFLLRMLMARERLGSTGLGEGIAIPHVRDPIVLRVPTALVTLTYLRQPVDFHAVDGQPVSILFTIVTPTVRVHLTLLSRLAVALQDAGLRAALNRREGLQPVLAHVARIEGQLKKPSSGRSAAA